jgi:hypothetical protein
MKFSIIVSWNFPEFKMIDFTEFRQNKNVKQNFITRNIFKIS